MEVFDNVTKIVKDDLSSELAKGGRLSIAAACFSIYAYAQVLFITHSSVIAVILSKEGVESEETEKYVSKIVENEPRANKAKFPRGFRT
jgi:hypothetical protein